MNWHLYVKRRSSPADDGKDGGGHQGDHGYHDHDDHNDHGDDYHDDQRWGVLSNAMILNQLFIIIVVFLLRAAES